MTTSIVWKFPLPIPESFLANEALREKLQLIADGKGEIPLFVAADMNNESTQMIPSRDCIDYERMMTML